MTVEVLGVALLVVVQGSAASVLLLATWSL